MPEATPGPNWEFDGFTVLPEMRLLLSAGIAVPLTGKAFDTLVILVANRDPWSRRTNSSGRCGPMWSSKKET